MANVQKLELTWIGKENRPRLEPRILLEDPEKSYHAKQRVSDKDIFDNRLIFGDNLLALKALEQEFAGKVKCVFIDPPYNTGNAFEHYDDGIEHSIWLTLMRDRLRLLHRLLAEDGVFCCHIDDSEGAYLKVLLDEVFGRDCFLVTLFIQVRYTNKTLSEDSDYQKVIEQCFVYCKEPKQFRPVKESIEYPVEKFEWAIEEHASGTPLHLGGKEVVVFKPGQFSIRKIEPHLSGLKETWATGSLLKQKGSSGEFFGKYLGPRKGEDGLGCLYRVKGIGEDGLGYRYFTGPKKESASKGKFYSGIPLDRREALEKGVSGKTKPIVNFYDLSGSFGNCGAEGGVEFRSGKKPERYLELILSRFSHKNDLILDSFAGSGTTGVVAHKMGRRWIMVELGEHAHTHIIPRLRAVIEGGDPTGVTEENEWKGGGGFRYYRLAPSLLSLDRFGHHIISSQYNAGMLAEAMCKLMGFRYEPGDVYWQQGRSTESDFLYTTTQTLSRQQIEALSEEVGPKRTLLICCSAFRAKATDFSNLTLRKIPMAVLSRCEWGKDDYSLNVASLPKAPVPDSDVFPDAALADRPPTNPTEARRRRTTAMVDAAPGLFDAVASEGREKE
jgi:adenine-specific DNA-methyltransferase